jgi:hypothetical protein
VSGRFFMRVIAEQYHMEFETFCGIRPHRSMTGEEYTERKNYMDALMASPQAKALFDETVAELKATS